MSSLLLKFAKSFAAGRISPEVFSIAYIELWRIERDDGSLQRDEAALSESLSTIFCLADLYNPDGEREKYELDEEGLRDEVTKAISVPDS
ncbi:MAG TPA: colicin immunity domain-containing protein [Lysobacter sp.]